MEPTIYCILKTNADSSKILPNTWNAENRPWEVKEFQMFFGRTGLDSEGNKLPRLFFSISNQKFYWSKLETVQVNGTGCIEIPTIDLKKELTPEEISELKLPIENIKCKNCIHHYKRRMNGCHSEQFKAM